MILINTYHILWIGIIIMVAGKLALEEYVETSTSTWEHIVSCHIYIFLD